MIIQIIDTIHEEAQLLPEADKRAVLLNLMQLIIEELKNEYSTTY